ncbi:MAG: hypothetical protein WBB76_04880 [Gaiellaceae bacterium]
MSDLTRFEAAARARGKTPSLYSSLFQEEVGRKGDSQQSVSEVQVQVDSLPSPRENGETFSVENQVGRAPLPADFKALVRPLEDLHPAWRLRNPGRQWCLDVYERDEGVFAALVAYAIEGWNDGTSDRPLGLLCMLCKEQLEEWGLPT